MKPQVEILKTVAREMVELARERTSSLLTTRGLAVSDRSLDRLLINAYLQGAIDGAHVEQLRAKSRGHYLRRRSVSPGAAAPQKEI